GRAERDVVADANGDVAAVAVHVGALPETASDVTDLEFEVVNEGRFEERFEFGFRALRVQRFGGRGGGGRAGTGLSGTVPGVFGLPIAQQVARRRSNDGVGRQAREVAAVAQQLFDIFGADDRSHFKAK